jgi:hypothetical protein
MEHRKHAESNATNDMVMGTGSKLKMVEPKLKKAWEGTHHCTAWVDRFS